VTALPSNVTSAYSYDPAYQLTQVLQGATKTEAYTYDAVTSANNSLLCHPPDYVECMPATLFAGP
jgi:YD repeat-containing protein